MHFLLTLPNVLLFFLLSSVAIVVSIIMIFILHRVIPYHVRYKDNPVIGNIGALISIIYGVLAGLSALYLINNNSYTADAIQREANAVADIYRDSKWLKEEDSRINIQNQIKEYINKVITVEWPLMANGKIVGNEGDVTIEKIANELILYRGESNPESLLLHDMLDQVRILYDARQQRIHMSYTQLSPELWTVLLIGTILTLCINYLFGMNFYLHLITVSAAGLMTASMFFLLITLDRPFQGEFGIEPDAFRRVLILIDKTGAKPLGTIPISPDMKKG